MLRVFKNCESTMSKTEVTVYVLTIIAIIAFSSPGWVSGQGQGNEGGELSSTTSTHAPPIPEDTTTTTESTTTSSTTVETTQTSTHVTESDATTTTSMIPDSTSLAPHNNEMYNALQERLLLVENSVSQIQTSFEAADVTLTDRLNNLQSTFENMGNDMKQQLAGLQLKIEELQVQPATTTQATAASPTSPKSSILSPTTILKLQEQIDEMKEDMITRQAEVKKDYDNSIASAKSELSKAIRTLESGKVQRLITINDVWRQNFKVINNTIARLNNRG